MRDSTWRVYEPNHRARIGFWFSIALMFRNIYYSRELIWQLFRRDFLMAYKKSILGMGWILLSPLAAIISWVFMNYAGVLSPGEMDIPYPVFVLLSTSIWGLMMGFYNAGLNIFTSSAGFIHQINYEHEAILFKETAQVIADFLIRFAGNVLVILAFGLSIHWKTIFFPLMWLPLFLFAGGLGLLLGVISIVIPDMKRIFSVLMNALMFLTPVVYVYESKEGIIGKIFYYNPLTYLIGAPRDLIFSGHYEHWNFYIISTLASLIFFLFCWRVFFMTEERVIERMM